MGGINTYGYVGGNPVNHSDSSGLFLDETRLQTALQAVSTATSVATSTAIATVAGVAGVLYPKSAGEGLDVVPKQDCPPDNGDNCSKVIAEIQDVMKELTKRYMGQCRNKKDQWDSHAEQFENKKRQLAKLVAQAEALSCVVPPKAYDWLQTQCSVPGSDRNSSPGC